MKKIAFLTAMQISLIHCSGQQNSIDEVAALYSNTQVISNIEYKKVDLIWQKTWKLRQR